MKREIESFLIEWKDSTIRQPLLVRGARQVGKTFSIMQFGRKNFDNCIAINFEEKPEYNQCFDNLDPKSIIDKISILGNVNIIPGKTLLFFDEIQEYPRAISSLRYFYEKLPELHIIGAGSLVEFALKSDNFKMPVGRVQSIYMHPLTFNEFLEAVNHSKLIEYLNTISPDDKIEEVYSKKLEELLRLYLVLGGMPKIIDAYVKNTSLNEIMFLQSSLLKTYEDDFAKYASTANHKYLKEVFSSAPRMVGKRYKYTNVNADIQSKYLKQSLDLLCDSSCITKVSHSAGNGLPFEAEINDKKFKIIFLDVGLMQRALGLNNSIIFEKGLMQINNGGVAEQFIGQELAALPNIYENKKLYFWTREAKGSNAEIDYLISIQNNPIPIEVKAGKTGTLRSMKLFLNEHPNCKFGVRFSMHDFSFYDNILSVPLYMVSQINRLVNLILLKG